ncbi:Vacuolar amino acid transporter 3 [Leucoagaricus sp. SymC.cos]|nr:Vacuolar amino acid transporter 3 [Leucoagaricus sp. SymC.cos]
MSSPSKPLNIKSTRTVAADQEAQSTPLVGTPDLRAQRAQFGTPPVPNIPPRGTPGRSTPVVIGTPQTGPTIDFGSSPLRPPIGTALGGISASRRPSVTLNSGGEVPHLDLDGLPDEEKAKVLARHLMLKEERTKAETSKNVPSASEASSSKSRPSSQHSSAPRDTGKAREESEAFPIPYDAPGADITHDVYKWHADQRRQAGRARAVSFAGLPQPPDPAFEHIHEPGGFRRNYVKLRANEQGAEEPQMLNNFIDFLLLFGHFAGEDLDEEEEEEEAKDEDEEQRAGPSEVEEVTETTPLIRGRIGSALSRSRSRSRQRRISAGPHRGNATVTQAVLMLLKSFIGTGVLFLGKAFYNGGLLLSSGLFVFIAAISLYSFLLLTKAKFVVSGSFGDIGGVLYGPWMRYAILTSIVISQLGFVATYTIFVAENLRAFTMAVSECLRIYSVQVFIYSQLIIFLPLALIRDIAKLSTAALIADVFIFAGLIYIFGSEMLILAQRGIGEVKMFNPTDFPLFIGTAVFSFEGIGLVVPITDAMKEPHKFPKVLTGVMFFLTLLFGGAGALSYLTFGKDIHTVVLVNLDPKNKVVLTVQFFYALAILLSVPLQLFPAVRIIENGLFTRSGKGNNQVKWMKNCFRFSMVMVCAVVSSYGAKDLDKFVAFVGCFACVPLCYVYPALLHLKACARTRKQKIADVTMITFGLFCSFYTSIQTLKLMLAPTAPPEVVHCDI